MNKLANPGYEESDFFPDQTQNHKTNARASPPTHCKSVFWM